VAKVLRGFVSIEAEIGKSKTIVASILALNNEFPAQVLTVDEVMGQIDIIVQLQAPDLDAMGQAITELQRVKWVARTTTFLAVPVRD